MDFCLLCTLKSLSWEAMLERGRITSASSSSHLVPLLLLQLVHGPLQALIQQVHQPHRVSGASLKLLPGQVWERAEESVRARSPRAEVCGRYRWQI